jgi:hypothetical protein
MYRLYTYDPGGTTGWACFEVNEEEGKGILVKSGEHELWHGIEEQLYPPNYLDNAFRVVYENIVPRHMDFNPIGLQTVGVIRYLCEKHGIPHTSQPNAVIHGVERWGIYDLDYVKSPHAKDAIRHGIVYLRKLGIAVKV